MGGVAVNVKSVCLTFGLSIQLSRIQRYLYLTAARPKRQLRLPWARQSATHSATAAYRGAVGNVGRSGSDNGTRALTTMGLAACTTAGS